MEIVLTFSNLRLTVNLGVRNCLKFFYSLQRKQIYPKECPTSLSNQRSLQQLWTDNGNDKFDPGVLYSVIQEILTEVAYQKVEHANTDDEILPENCSRWTVTILVEDNIDRLEETLSGKLLSLRKSIYMF